MNIIVLQDVGSLTSGSGFCNCIKTAFLTSNKLISAGIDDQYIYYKDVMDSLHINLKIDVLVNYHENENEIEANGLRGLKQMIKKFNNSKGKSSKEIINFKMILKNFENVYKTFVDMQDEALDRGYGTAIMREMIDDENFYLLPPRWTSADNTEIGHTKVSDIFTLQFPNDQASNFMFFLNLESTKEEVSFFEESENIDTNNAENVNFTYSENAFVSPMLNLLTANDMKAVKIQLEDSTKEFREKMDEWIQICYKNPTTNEGLKYFKSNVKPTLKNFETKLFENHIIKNSSNDLIKNRQSQIIIGQMPVEKIWDLMKQTNNMSAEEYKTVMDIKAQQPEKFEGRWPIMLLKPIYFNDYSPFNSIVELTEKEIKSVRKTISLD